MRAEGAVAARLAVVVQPRAPRDEVVAAAGTSLRVRVSAPPAGGAANEAVRRLVAAALGCPPSAVTILRGHASRVKLLGVRGLDAAAVQARLAALRPGG